MLVPWRRWPELGPRRLTNPYTAGSFARRALEAKQAQSPGRQTGPARTFSHALPLPLSPGANERALARRSSLSGAGALSLSCSLSLSLSLTLSLSLSLPLPLSHSEKVHDLFRTGCVLCIAAPLIALRGMFGHTLLRSVRSDKGLGLRCPSSRHPPNKSWGFGLSQAGKRRI